MRVISIIWIAFSILSIAALSSTPSENNSTSTFSIEDEISKIAASCLTDQDYIDLTGNVVAIFWAEHIGRELIEKSILAIGLRELRALLNFEPWTPSSVKTMNLTSADIETSPKAYYEMKEDKRNPKTFGVFVDQKNLSRGMVFMDQRYPMIGKIFKTKFEEVRDGVVDRELVDKIFEEFDVLNERLEQAGKKLIWNEECKHINSLPRWFFD